MLEYVNEAKGPYTQTLQILHVVRYEPEVDWNIFQPK
jgi:hypothetical protein